MDALRLAKKLFGRPKPLPAGSSSPARLWLDPGFVGSVAIGLIAIGLVWGAAWRSSTSDLRHAEETAYDYTANLARAFKEHITRLLQANDQILLFARSSYAKDPAGFDLSAWAREQEFSAKVALQISIIDRSGILVASTLGMPAERIDLSDR